MARIRTIKPDMRDSVHLARCCREGRWFFAILLTEMDDKGRVAYTPKKLAGILYPHDDDVDGPLIRYWVEELCENGMLVEYEHGGRRFLCAPNFNVHQVINKPTPSRLPNPFDSSLIQGALPEHSGSATVPEVGSRKLEKGSRKGGVGGKPRTPKPVAVDLPENEIKPIPESERLAMKQRLDSTFAQTAERRRMKP